MSRSARRAGFSLMEVLLATAILLGSTLMLVELASIGRRYIQSVNERTTAQLLCESKLNELLSGVDVIEDVEQRLFKDHPDWVYSIETQPVSGLNLVALHVTVTQQFQERQNLAIRGKPKTFTLVRWIRSQQPRQFREPQTTEPTS